MRRRSVLGSLLALLVAAPKAVFGAESTEGTIDNDYIRELQEKQKQNQQELERAKSEQELAQQEAARTQRVQAAAAANLQEVENLLYAKIEELNATQFQIDRLQVEIHRLTQDTVREEAILADEQEVASGRLRAVYKLSRVSPLEIILSSSSFSDALNRVTLFRRILDDDLRQVRATQERKAELDAKRATLVQKQAEVDALKRQLDRQQADLQNLLATREVLLVNAEREAASASYRNASLQQEIARRKVADLELAADIEAAIEWLQKNNIKLPEYAEAGWRRPAAGWISAGYGVRTWLQAFHSGIDYAVARGSPVRASQDGVVIKVGYAIQGERWSSYGMRVIIQHSWHEVSVYAHLDDARSLPVKEGSQVHRGQTIGFVGMTGFTSGPHLHFEIRLDNVPNNPNKWLR